MEQSYRVIELALGALVTRRGEMNDTEGAVTTKRSTCCPFMTKVQTSKNPRWFDCPILLKRLFASSRSLKQSVLRLGLDEDRHFRVGVFPQCEEFLIGSFSLHLVPAQHVRSG